jgi:hypothetical protein
MCFTRRTSAMDKNNENTSTLMRGFTDNKTSSFPVKFLGILLASVILGIGTGFLLARSIGNNGGSNLVGKLVNTSIPSGKIYGNGDPKIFKDVAEGILKEGGIEGEGQYHLVRSGGDSQNVYMTSSSVDLSQFVDRKIKVWGQTQKAQKAGWLMDVGKVETL